MKTEKFNLSEKMKDLHFHLYPHGIIKENVIEVSDVKEFLKRLKDEMKKLSYKEEEWISQSLDTIEDRIDKLAGSQLAGGEDD